VAKLLIFVPIPQFSNFLLLIAPNSFAPETSFAASWTGHYNVALGCMVGSFKIMDCWRWNKHLASGIHPVL
jgi:hypothetical protein